MPAVSSYTGNLFVIAAPSGSGKSTLVKALMEVDARVSPSISHTTREARGQEMSGREYYFISEAEFDAMAARGEFVEHARVHGHSYGTSRMAIASCMKTGRDVVLEIDWQGALQIRRLFPATVLVFVLPPSWEELRSRLERRGEDQANDIELRLTNARLESAQIHYFDYVIINDDFERALFDLKTIVHAHRLRYAAQKHSHAETFQKLGLDSVTGK